MAVADATSEPRTDAESNAMPLAQGDDTVITMRQDQLPFAVFTDGLAH